MSTTVPLTLKRLAHGKLTPADDDVAAEEPLEIRVEGQNFAVVMRTPGHDRELTAGFLMTEGVIGGMKDVFDITTCVTPGAGGKENTIDVALRNPKAFERAKHARSSIASASCGVCGKLSIESVLRHRARVESALQVTAETILSLPSRLSTEQSGFKRSGGLHACALFNQRGELLQIREDIGRHNALDKLIGWALLTGFEQLGECLLLLSGRTSFEMMQKAQAAGIVIVAAISAPSSLAVKFAQESGQTLAGFVRGETMNVYAGAERILLKARARSRPEGKRRTGARK